MRSKLTYLLLAALLAVVGCAGPNLPSEAKDPELSGLMKLGQTVPPRMSRVHVDAGYGPIDLAVHETGDGDADRVVVMLHGVLSDSDMWRYVRGTLGTSYDLIAIDLPGCGRSERPDPAALGRGAYGPTMLARHVLSALRERLAARGDAGETPVTILAHSLGGMITLRMFADAHIRDEYSDVLDRVDGLVLFTPVDVAVEKDIPTFRAIAQVSDAEMAVADVTGLLRVKVTAATRDGVVDANRATREEARRTLDLLRDRPRRRAAQAMIRLAVPARNNRPSWDRIEPIVRSYKNVDIPCLIVWGARDELLPLSMGFKLNYHLPHARLHVINRGMHCLPVERPTECAQLVHDFIANGAEERPAVVWMDGPTPDRELDVRLARATRN
jgi:pimeloyl-ACP methyl ester carboxylesterase